MQPTLGGEADDSRYSAPEIQRPEDYGLDNILLTRESDVYEMAMVIYEARYYRTVSSGPKVRSHASLLGFDGEQTVLQLRRSHHTTKGASWGNSSTTLGQD